MLNLFATLEMRGHLKRFMKNQSVVAITVHGGDVAFVKVASIGWFTVTLDLLDIDEETWLARETVAIHDVLAINENSVTRARVQLMLQDASPAEKQSFCEAYRSMGHSVDEEGMDF